MMSKFTFVKYQGAGNDFILIDNRDGHFPLHDSLLIQRMCHRQFGIGADGLILLCSAPQHALQMRIFNSSDGCEAESCGNGLRCLLLFLDELGIHQSSYRIKTKENEVIGFLDQGNPVIDLGIPNHWRMEVATETGIVHYLHTGAPHAVQFVPDVDKVSLPLVAPPLRRQFQANVNFAAIQEDKSIKMRTFEKGVEGETLSCGTGAAAVAALAIRLYGLRGSVSIHCRGGKLLVKEEIGRLFLSGPAEKVFSGSWALPKPTKGLCPLET